MYACIMNWRLKYGWIEISSKNANYSKRTKLFKKKLKNQTKQFLNFWFQNAEIIFDSIFFTIVDWDMKKKNEKKWFKNTKNANKFFNVCVCLIKTKNYVSILLSVSFFY